MAEKAQLILTYSVHDERVGVCHFIKAFDVQLNHVIQDVERTASCFRMWLYHY